MTDVVKMTDEILVVSFGTTSPESRELNIGAVEEAIREAAPDGWGIRRCFTSGMIRRIIEKREGISIDGPAEALMKAAERGVRRIAVQPTHLMKGLEYEKLRNIFEEYSGLFVETALGDPLLSSQEDLVRTAEAIKDAASCYDDGSTAIVLMGHGTDAASNAVYNEMQAVLAMRGMSNYYIGTVEAEPSLDSVLAAVGESGCRRVVLRPLMLVAGNHAVNDMASAEDPDSWYSRFTSLGYETICIIEGLGQIPAIREIYAEHAGKAWNMIERQS